LIRPIRPYLVEQSIRTLVFVPGGVLRLIPMASLYDGKHFLVETFAIATIPALELLDSGPIGFSANYAFLGGLSQAQGEFTALPYVPRELAGIQSTLGLATLVLDEDFRKSEIASLLEATEFNIVHIATHAQFGATPDETYLLAYDGRISMDELANWVGAFRYRETPLDLIVLSACESAAGDEQAALGLSGIAIKAGAQSALGTLWSVNDDATARLIDAFYRGLVIDKLSRAEALRRAQLELLADPSFSHPYYWAPFLLINAWL
jgi:CHAT domain-containing protein